MGGSWQCRHRRQWRKAEGYDCLDGNDMADSMVWLEPEMHIAWAKTTACVFHALRVDVDVDAASPWDRAPAHSAANAGTAGSE